MGTFILIKTGFSVRAMDDCQTLEECQALLEQYEQRIRYYESNIAQNQAEQTTLNNKIYALKQEVNKLEYQIKKSNLIINDLASQAQDTEQSIKDTSQEIEKLKERLATILRRIHEEDQKSFLEIFIINDNLSEFFESLFSLEGLLVENQEILNNVKELKTDLEDQEIVLNKEKQDWERMKKVQILQKMRSQEVRNEKERLLFETKGEEAEYQKLLQQNQARAQQIRQRIFSLIGISDAPTFGEAVEIAKYVESITGVRPAFLLAILRQESNIGQNVGQCYLKNPETGAGIVASTGQARDRVMKPTRDVSPFLQTCKEVGRDPYNTLVSCPMSFGYGGAMGPAQFIPSTWAIYKNRVSAITGKPADPWDIRDAFLAAGLYAKDAGAAAQTYNAEWRAAMVYFSGSTNPAYSFYGDSVMAITAQYERDIEQLEKYK